jgi:hypothetical protein
LLRKETPLELLEVARIGGEAETVKRVMGDILSRELELVISHLANIKPDALAYAKIAGQAQVLFKIKKTFDISAAEGKDAAERLKE